MFKYLLLVLFLAFYFIPLNKVEAKTISVPILMYHYIGNNPNPADLARNDLSVTPDNFDAQLGYLASHGYTPITLDTLYGIYNNQVTPPLKPIVLTFDDGYVDFYINAFPILRKYGFHAVSFIPTGLMNQGYYMSWNQIREISQTGLVTFEDHGVTHSNLTLLSAGKILKEVTDSKNILQSITGYPVNFIAYPYGISNNLVISLSQKAGLIGGVGTWRAKATGPSMNMPRIKVSGYLNLNQFISIL